MVDYNFTLESFASDAAFEEKYGVGHSGRMYLNTTDNLPHLYSSGSWVVINNHDYLINNGSKTHPQIDSHIANPDIHFPMLNEDDMASNSTTACPTEKSVKAYTNAHIADGTVHFLMLNEDNMASQSMVATASQRSIKRYVDSNFIGTLVYGETLAVGDLIELNSLGQAKKLVSSENFFGIAQDSGVSGYTGVVSVLGRVSNVHSAQTPGTVAYIQVNGTLGGTVTAYPAGRWISPTRLKVTKNP